MQQLNDEDFEDVQTGDISEIGLPATGRQSKYDTLIRKIEDLEPGTYLRLNVPEDMAPATYHARIYSGVKKRCEILEIELVESIGYTLIEDEEGNALIIRKK